jgi:hypothetical protein
MVCTAPAAGAGSGIDLTFCEAALPHLTQSSMACGGAPGVKAPPLQHVERTVGQRVHMGFVLAVEKLVILVGSLVHPRETDGLFDVIHAYVPHCRRRHTRLLAAPTESVAGVALTLSLSRKRERGRC